MSARACNLCEWVGSEPECAWLGRLGPLCPQCRETTVELPDLPDPLSPDDEAEPLFPRDHLPVGST